MFGGFSGLVLVLGLVCHFVRRYSCLGVWPIGGIDIFSHIFVESLGLVA